jgi:hypothetical protein
VGHISANQNLASIQISQTTMDNIFHIPRLPTSPMWRRTLISELCNNETKPKGGIMFGGKLHRSEQTGLNCKTGV